MKRGTMIVGGIDLSLSAAGICRSSRAAQHGHAGLDLDRHELELCKADGALTALTLAAKLSACEMFAARLALTVRADRAPDLVALESPTVVRGAGGVFERGYVYYLLVSALLNMGVAVVEVSPAQLKQFVAGVGNASKGAMIDSIARLWPEYETGGDDNLADAAGLAAVACTLLGHEWARPLTLPRLKSLKLLKVINP